MTQPEQPTNPDPSGKQPSRKRKQAISQDPSGKKPSRKKKPSTKEPSRKKRPHKYDTCLKDWVDLQPADILPVLLPGTTYEETLNVEISRSMMRADRVFKIRYCGEEHVLHLEFETGTDQDLHSRLLVYNSVLYRDYKLPVISIVIYPFEGEQATSPLCIMSNGEEILTFKFRTLSLFTWEAEQFVREHRACMYPLLPAMNGVHAELISQVMQELTELYRQDQVSLAQQFSWMSILLERTGTVTDLEKSRIEERLTMFDQLWNESPRVQQMKKQFREEAKKEAKKESEQKFEQERLRLQQEQLQLQQKAEQKFEQERLRLQQEAEQERLKIRRSSLVSFIRGRFPDLTDFAQQQVERFDQPAALDLLIQQVAVAPDANAVRFALNAGTQ